VWRVEDGKRRYGDEMSEIREMTLQTIIDSFHAGAAAIRMKQELQPGGGDGDKVFPPTYASKGNESGPQYAKETRMVNGNPVSTVMLDSVQSQANRMEAALVALCREGRLSLPILSVELPVGDNGRKTLYTSLDLPHRVYDGRFRACTLDGVPFPQSELNRILARASAEFATPLYRYCPTALVFGGWNSHDTKDSGTQARFQRALTSEIIGIDAEYDTRKMGGASDPLGILATTKVFPAKKEYPYDWTLENSKKAAAATKPSTFGLSAIAPSTDRQGGGVTISKAIQTMVISLSYLRRLRFPAEKGAASSPEGDEAGRVVLAALALCAVEATVNRGYDLRSRCLLLPTDRPVYEVVGPTAADTKRYSLGDGVSLLHQALEQAEALGLSWEQEEVSLKPSPEFLKLLEQNAAAVVLPEGGGE